MIHDLDISFFSLVVRSDDKSIHTTQWWFNDRDDDRDGMLMFETPTQQNLNYTTFGLKLLELYILSFLFGFLSVYGNVRTCFCKWCIDDVFRSDLFHSWVLHVCSVTGPSCLFYTQPHIHTLLANFKLDRKSDSVFVCFVLLSASILPQPF